MVVYILNSPVLTDWGRYDFEPATLSEVKALMRNGYVSAVGHEATAMFLSKLTGSLIPVNRVPITMRSGDVAIVFRVMTRLPEGRVLSEEEMQAIPYSLGILRKL